MTPTKGIPPPPKDKEHFTPRDDRFIAGWNAAIDYILKRVITRLITALRRLRRE